MRRFIEFISILLLAVCAMGQQLENKTFNNLTARGTFENEGVTSITTMTMVAGGDIRPSADSTAAINIAQADGTDFVIFDSSNGRMGIGGPPNQRFFILDNTGNAQFNITNNADQDLNMTVTAGGAGDKYALIAPSVNTSLAFGVNGAEVMRIKGSSVGIGTASPSANLHIYESSAASNMELLRLDNPDGAGKGSRISFNQGAIEYGRISSQFVSSAGQLDLGTASYLQTIVLKAGNVGMGTAAPTQLLTLLNSSDGDPTILMGDNTKSGIIDATANMFINADSDNSAAAGVIAFGFNRTGYTGGSEVVRISESAGGVGIGTATNTSNTLQVYRNLAAASTSGPVVSIHQDSSSDDQPCLTLRQDASTVSAFEVYTGAVLRAYILGDGSAKFYTQVEVSGMFYMGLITAAPSPPVEGMIYGNAVDHHLYYYNGSGWVQLDN